MYDLPWWLMGFACLTLVCLVVLAWIVLGVSRTNPPPTSLQEDFDDRPRRWPKPE